MGLSCWLVFCVCSLLLLLLLLLLWWQVGVCLSLRPERVGFRTQPDVRPQLGSSSIPLLSSWIPAAGFRDINIILSTAHLGNQRQLRNCTVTTALQLHKSNCTNTTQHNTTQHRIRTNKQTNKQTNRNMGNGISEQRVPLRQPFHHTRAY